MNNRHPHKRNVFKLNLIMTDLGIIEECIDGDMAKIHSIMSIERMLNDLLQTNFIKYRNKKGLRNEHFSDEHFIQLLYTTNQFKYIFKIKTYWTALYESAKFCKRLIKYTPSFNVYNLSYLDDRWINKIRSYVTFATQIILFFNLFHILQDDRLVDWSQDLDAFEGYEYFVFAAVICVALVLLVRKQMNGFFEFNQTFELTLFGILSSLDLDLLFSLIINLVMSLLLVPLSFIIIIYSDNSLELVLNCLAALFVLELDDQVIDLALNDERCIYLDYIAKSIVVKQLINNEELEELNKLITYDWHYNFVYAMDAKLMSLRFDDDCDVYNAQDVLVPLRLDLRSGEWSNVMEPSTLKQRYLCFRIVNENMCHLRLLNDRDIEAASYWELIIDPFEKIMRRRREKEGLFARLLTQKYDQGRNPTPCRGTWFFVKWSNDSEGSMEYYCNEVDCKPTLSSPNTVLIAKCPYRAFVEQQCTECQQKKKGHGGEPNKHKDVMGTYSSIKYVQVYSFANPLKMNFYRYNEGD